MLPALLGHLANGTAFSKDAENDSESVRCCWLLTKTSQSHKGKFYKREMQLQTPSGEKMPFASLLYGLPPPTSTALPWQIAQRRPIQ